MTLRRDGERAGEGAGQAAGQSVSGLRSGFVRVRAGESVQGGTTGMMLRRWATGALVMGVMLAGRATPPAFAQPGASARSYYVSVAAESE